MAVSFIDQGVGVLRKRLVFASMGYFGSTVLMQGVAQLCALWVIMALVLAGCAAPASHYARTATNSLHMQAELEVFQQPVKASVRLLGDGQEALLARLALIARAQTQLDLQVYILKTDSSANLILQALLQAADRGVLVRLLVDDFGSAQQDDRLASLASHPNIAVRLFNPSRSRQLPLADLLFSFSLQSRRMHNKLMLADNSLAILGGRNIGDEYFTATANASFHDADILTGQAFAARLQHAFGLYWHHALSVPVEAIRPGVQPNAYQELRTQLPITAAQSTLVVQAGEYNHKVLEQLRYGAKVEGYILLDHPDKVLRPSADKVGHLVPAMQQVLSGVKQSALMVSAYFVPQPELIKKFEQWIAEGASVTVLTNSLAATDVAAVHAGYAPFRQSLLDAGVGLWEFKPDSKKGGSRVATAVTGSSKASLHAKTFVFDQRYLFIGSLNLDPRSVSINTEIGILLDAPKHAAEVTAAINKLLPYRAYQLVLNNEAGALCRISWRELIEKTGPAPEYKTHCTEPKASVFRRLFVNLLSWLPISKQL
ncbi:phospholipase D family protein [Rheinheimera sediminis]|nr:phospholipase D family protein [Rheinheimera sp. YQF-1]